MDKRGGKRPGAGRKKLPDHLRKVPFNTRIPQWLKSWLTSQDTSAPVLIEDAIVLVYGEPVD